MTDFTNMSQEEVNNHIQSLFRTHTPLRDDNEIRLNIAGKLLDDFILIAQEHCRKNGIKLDEAFICKHIGDLEFIEQLFEEYADNHHEDYDRDDRTYSEIRRPHYINALLTRPFLQEGHREISDTIKEVLKK